MIAAENPIVVLSKKTKNIKILLKKIRASKHFWLLLKTYIDIVMGAYITNMLFIIFESIQESIVVEGSDAFVPRSALTLTYPPGMKVFVRP